MHEVVDHLDDVFSTVSVEIKQVDGHIVVQMPSWVEALALNARDLHKVCLSAPELASLRNICRVVWPEALKRHVK